MNLATINPPRTQKQNGSCIGKKEQHWYANVDPLKPALRPFGNISNETCDWASPPHTTHLPSTPHTHTKIHTDVRAHTHKQTICGPQLEFWEILGEHQVTAAKCGDEGTKARPRNLYVVQRFWDKKHSIILLGA